MEAAHWIFLLAIAILTALMLSFSLAARPKSRGYAVARRVFWAVAVLQGANALGLVGLNPLTAATVALLGAPGLGALLALAGM